jgi:hypothetical protein
MIRLKAKTTLGFIGVNLIFMSLLGVILYKFLGNNYLIYRLYKIYCLFFGGLKPPALAFLLDYAGK